VRPFPNVNGGRWKVSTDGGTRPLWARSGQLFYLAGARNQGLTGAIMSVPVEHQATWTTATPTKLFEGEYLAPANGRTYDISADAKRFLMIKPADQAPPPSVVVIQNWFEELKRRVPTK